MTKLRSAILLSISLLLFALTVNPAALAVVSTAEQPLLYPRPCTVTLDGAIQNIRPLYWNQNSQSMVALADAPWLFSCNIQFQADGTLLVNHLDITQSFSPQEYISTKSLEGLTPHERLDAVYVPLRRLAQDFGFGVVYQNQGPVIALQSPGYQGLPATPSPGPLLSLLPCIVALDGQIQNIHPIYLNQNGDSMVTLTDAALLFSAYIQFQADGSVLVNHLGATQTILPQEYISTGPLEVLTPSERLEVVYVPLRRLASGFAFEVTYKIQGPVISLRSQAYTGPDEVIPVLQVAPEPVEEISSDPPKNLPIWGIMGPELKSRWPEADFIAAYYTTLINSPAARTNNILVASTSIDGTILNSGATFSFNRTVGQRTIDASYQVAKIFVGDEIVDGLGGGICQVSSTIYNTALEAGLQIVERHPHTLPVTYAAPGRDATVSWGSADLKFKNNLGRPLQIRCGVYGPYVLTAFVEVD